MDTKEQEVKQKTNQKIKLNMNKPTILVGLHVTKIELDYFKYNEFNIIQVSLPKERKPLFLDNTLALEYVLGYLGFEMKTPEHYKIHIYLNSILEDVFAKVCDFEYDKPKYQLSYVSPSEEDCCEPIIRVLTYPNKKSLVDSKIEDIFIKSITDRGIFGLKASDYPQPFVTDWKPPYTVVYNLGVPKGSSIDTVINYLDNIDTEII